MGECININLIITDFDKTKKEQIKKEINAIHNLNFDEWSEGPNRISTERVCAVSYSQLETIHKNIQYAIWKANKADCLIQIEVSFVEQTPREEYETDEDDYAEYKRYLKLKPFE